MSNNDKTMIDFERRLSSLEAEVVRLKETPVGASSEVSQGGEAAPDHWLEKDYNDREVRRDPKFWEGPSFVGRKWSACPVAYLEKLAKFLEFKAAKERAEVPVKLNDKGKPWHEFTAMDAKLVRAWVARKKRTNADALPGDELPDTGDGSLPF